MTVIDDKDLLQTPVEKVTYKPVRLVHKYIAKYRGHIINAKEVQI